MDDSISRINLSNDHGNNNKIIKETLNQITDYMNANQLVINQDKSQLLVITENNSIRNNISIDIEGQI